MADDSTLIPVLDEAEAHLPTGVPVTEHTDEAEWPQVENLLIAVALATIGARWTLHNVHEVIGGHSADDRAVFRFAPVTKIRNGSGHVTVVNVAQLLSMFRSGELEKVDPEHPFLYCLQTLTNLQRMRDLTNHGTKVYGFRSDPLAGMTALIQEGRPAGLDKLSKLFKRSGKLSHLKSPLKK